MNIRRFIAGVMAVCVMGAALPSAYGKTADNAVITASAVTEYTEGTYEQLTYKNYGDHIETSDCDISATSVVIPKEIDGVPVTMIGDSTFNHIFVYKNLTEIIIPDSVTSIGSYAFYNCAGLTELIIPDSVTSIGTSAFHGCTGLTEITIPDSVKSIGVNAFNECKNLTKITVYNPLCQIAPKAINDTATIYGYENSTAQEYAEKYERKFVSLGKAPAMPDEVLEYIILNGENILITGCDKSAVSVEIPAEIHGFPVTSIKTKAFKDCKELKKIIIHRGVTEIEDYAFSFCKSLTEITIPDSVTSIGDNAFEYCSELTKITIPDSVTSIGSMAFHRCKKLTEITIPKEVTSIGYSAFSNCESLTEITIPNGVTSIDRDVFHSCSKLTEITIPDSVTSIGEGAFCLCQNLTKINIPDSVTTIGESAFSGCKGLTEITIPDSVTSIGECAFANCNNLVLTTSNVDILVEKKGIYDILMVNYPRQKLNYTITETDQSNIAKSNSVKAEIDYSTINNSAAIAIFDSLDKLHECTDSKGNVYVIGGLEDSITLFSENTDKKPVTIENEGFTFGAATIDENDNLYVLWGYSISEDIIEEEKEKKTENLVAMKYDLNGNILGRCGIPITTSRAQYPFWSGNASMAVKDNVIGCFFNIKWINGHQGSEFAAIDRNTMELIKFSDHEGSHSFGVSLITTDYGFAGIQRGDAGLGRGINFNIYFVSDNEVEVGLDDSKYNGSKILFSASGQYGTNDKRIDGNATYLHMGGLAKSATTYAVVGKSERIYSTMEYYGKSGLRTYNYDVFLKIADQTLAKKASDLAGEERVDVETGKTANYNIVWLTECNETEKAGQVKVVTLADGSYCVLWEKFVNDKFDSIRYVITDECGNILRHETGIYGARLSDTSVQPIVEDYTLKWAVADAENKCINFYTVDLNDFSETPTNDMFGDANCDGKVTIADSTAILQALGNPDKYGLSEQGAINADCCNHGDGVLTSDALAIQMVDAGLLKQEQLPIAKLPNN